MNAVSIHYWAVLVAAVANMVVGSIWYGPLFGKKWRHLMGFSLEEVKSMKMSPTKAMFGGFLAALVMAYVLAHFVGYLGVTSVVGAWQLAFWAWLGFTATIQVGTVLWEGKSWNLFFLNAAQSLVSLFAMTVILALW